MAYGPEVQIGYGYYEMRVVHAPTGVQLDFRIDATSPASGNPTQAQRDAVFQGLVTMLANVSGVTVTATKRGLFSATVTP